MEGKKCLHSSSIPLIHNLGRIRIKSYMRASRPFLDITTLRESSLLPISHVQPKIREFADRLESEHEIDIVIVRDIVKGCESFEVEGSHPGEVSCACCKRDVGYWHCGIFWDGGAKWREGDTDS